MTRPLLLLALAAACRGTSAEGDANRALMLDAPLARGVSPAVVARRDTLHLAWVTLDSAEHGHLYTARDGGAPRELVDPLGAAQFDPETPPKLDALPDGALALSYVVTVPDSTAKYGARVGLRFTRSDDGGQTWSPPVSIADDGDLGRYRNDHTMHVARDGRVYVAWLDEREAGLIRVTMARSDDRGATWSRNVAVDSAEACGCCRTPIATGPDGAVYTVWRKILPGGIRDFVMARSTDHGATWATPVRVHADDFKIASCPDAGPSVAVDDANRVHVAWWTGAEGAAGVKYASSDDGGAQFGAPVALGVASQSRAAHPRLVLGPGGRVVVAWDDGTTSPPRIALRVSRDRGAQFDSTRYLSEPATTASFPVMALRGDRLTVLWQERGPSVGSPTPGAAPPEVPAPWRAWDGTRAVRLVRVDATLP